MSRVFCWEYCSIGHPAAHRANFDARWYYTRHRFELLLRCGLKENQNYLSSSRSRAVSFFEGC